ncbi:phosphate acyltransferase [Streptomyces sp. YIM S03343]
MRDFEELKRQALTGDVRRRCAVPGAADAHALEAVFLAQRQGYVHPVLIGDPQEIREITESLGFGADLRTVVECPPTRNPAEIAVELVREGQADFILKGRLTTKELLKPVLDKKDGLNDEGFVTHLGVMQLAGYHKLLAMSDSAVIPYPTVDDKRRIVKVCTDALRKLGIERPVVAALCSVEVVNPRMTETVEARRLQELSESGEFGDAVVVGPISYDLATSKESAEIKGFASPHAGDVDMLLVPQMVTGNVMSKIWNADPKNILAGCLVGTRAPVALTSRSATMEEKIHSILLCSMLSGAPEPALTRSNGPADDRAARSSHDAE